MSRYHFLKISNAELPRVQAILSGNGLDGVRIGAAPFSQGYSIIACPEDGDAAEIVRGEVPSETVSVDELRQMPS